MNESRIEAALQKLDERFDRLEQRLPTLATRDDLARFPSQDDPKGFATKEDLQAVPTRDDPKGLATTDDVKAEGEVTRRHFDAVAEEFLSQIRLVSEGTDMLSERVDRELGDVRAVVHGLDRRVMRLEADRLKR